MSKFEKVCGTCQSIRFAGPQELFQEAGRCARERESGRCYVAVSAEPCELWTLRPKSARDRDAAKAANHATVVAAVNRRAHQRRRF